MSVGGVALCFRYHRRDDGGRGRRKKDVATIYEGGCHPNINVLGDFGRMHFIRLKTDGRVVISNDVWYEGPALPVEPCCDHGLQLSTKAVRVRWGSDRRVRWSSELKRIVEGDSTRVTHVKIGGGPIRPYEGREQVEAIVAGRGGRFYEDRKKTNHRSPPPQCEFLWLLYHENRGDGDSGSSCLRIEDEFVEYVFHEPEWTDGRTREEMKEAENVRSLLASSGPGSASKTAAISFRQRVRGRGDYCVATIYKDSPRPLSLQGSFPWRKLELQCIRLDDGRVIVTNDVWYDHPHNPRGEDLRQPIVPPVGVGEALSTTVRRVVRREDLLRMMTNRAVRITHFKVGGEPIRLYRKPSQLISIDVFTPRTTNPCRGSYLWLFYHARGGDAPSRDRRLRRKERFVEYVLRYPEWNDGRPASSEVPKCGKGGEDESTQPTVDSDAESYECVESE